MFLLAFHSHTATLEIWLCRLGNLYGTGARWVYTKFIGEELEFVKNFLTPLLIAVLPTRILHSDNPGLINSFMQPSGLSL